MDGDGGDLSVKISDSNSSLLRMVCLRSKASDLADVDGGLKGCANGGRVHGDGKTPGCVKSSR